MATISSTSIPSIQTQRSNKAPEGNDIASQIARISQQIVKLTQQLKEIADTNGSAEDKQKQAELIQQQITLLEAQLAQLQRLQAERVQEREQRSSLNASLPGSVEKTSHIDIYI
ncbi:FlxA-like family protein [Pseudocitrobacter faecalis]|uniref:FlxA-like family protein n=1 Tax=Pseudocitrobacter faecalis TaxID=1398493 RepID=UPI0039F04C46